MKHIFFSGIGGSGIGPLALIAHQAGYTVSGSDKQDSDYITNLKKHGITNIYIGQTKDAIAKLHAEQPIDWIVFSSAVFIENENRNQNRNLSPDQSHNHPEVTFALEHDIHMSKRDAFLTMLLEETGQKLIAIAGTHGKTTTTAMTIWLFKQLSIPISYSVGAKLSFGAMGEFDRNAEYFVYEADEFDRNFLAFKPYISLITGVAWDHPDIYPTQENYNKAFLQFLSQSHHAVIWDEDASNNLDSASTQGEIVTISESKIPKELQLIGQVNRRNAWQVISAFDCISETIAQKDQDYRERIKLMNAFVGLSRRFERLKDSIYTDYAHTPEKIHGALQTAHEVAGRNVIVVYEGLHNTRQHFIKEQLKTLFAGIKKVYVVPSYLAREDSSLEMLTPEKLCHEIMKEPKNREAAQLDTLLLEQIRQHAADGDLVLCLSAGGGGSLDEWLRKEL